MPSTKFFEISKFLTRGLKCLNLVMMMKGWLVHYPDHVTLFHLDRKIYVNITTRHSYQSDRPINLHHSIPQEHATELKMSCPYLCTAIQFIKCFALSQLIYGKEGHNTCSTYLIILYYIVFMNFLKLFFSRILCTFVDQPI